MAAVVVIGGTVLDIQAKPDAGDLRRASSVPGKVVQLPGGVGRNIAEAAHHLLQAQQQQQQQPQEQQETQQTQQRGPSGGVLLISVVGRDAAADALLASFQQLGMSTEGILRSSRVATPCVVALLDSGGEVAASVADVAAPALELTHDVVRRHAGAIRRASLLVLDANLEPPTLAAAAAAAAGAGVPVLFEPVSVPKAVRCLHVLSHLSVLTPNAQELLAIADAVQQQAQLPPLPRPPHSMHDGRCSGQPPSPQQLLMQLALAAAVVLRQGVKHIVLTLGAQGAALLSLQSSSSSSGQQPHHAARQVLRAQHVPAAPCACVVNLSGAGDTLTGGFAAALARGDSMLQALAAGVAAARVAVECGANVPGPADGLTHGAVQRQAAALLARATDWQLPLGAAL